MPTSYHQKWKTQDAQDGVLFIESDQDPTAHLCSDAAKIPSHSPSLANRSATARFSAWWINFDEIPASAKAPHSFPCNSASKKRGSPKLQVQIIQSSHIHHISRPGLSDALNAIFKYFIISMPVSVTQICQPELM